MISIIISSILVTAFSLLILFKFLNKPIIYSTRKLHSKVCGYRLSTIFFSSNAKLIIVPNIVVALIVKNTKLLFSFDKCEDMLCNENRAFMRIKNFLLVFDKNCIKIKGNGQFNFSVTRPNSKFTFDSRHQALSIEKQKLMFTGFKNLEVQGGSVLSFNGEINNEASINYEDFKLRAVRQESKQILTEYFGFIDTSNWESIPKFNVILSPENALKRRYLSELLDSKNLKIYIPKTKNSLFLEKIGREFCFTKCFLSLDKLGLSKILRFSRSKNTLFIKDLLTNFEIVIKVNGDFSYSQCVILKEMFLYISAVEKRKAVVEILPKVIENTFLFSELIKGEGGRFPKSVSINSFLYNLNRLTLHGVYLRIDTLFNLLNPTFLNVNQQFLLANLLITYINVFERYDLLGRNDVKDLLYDSLSKNLQTITLQKCVYFKKILPYITDDTLSNRALDVVLDKKTIKKNMEYEYYLNVVLGLRLSGTKLFLEPDIDARFNIEIFMHGHNIHLIKQGVGRNLKVENIVMSGVEFLDLVEYPSNFIIEFI